MMKLAWTQLYSETPARTVYSRLCQIGVDDVHCLSMSMIVLRCVPLLVLPLQLWSTVPL